MVCVNHMGNPTIFLVPSMSTNTIPTTCIHFCTNPKSEYSDETFPTSLGKIKFSQCMVALSSFIESEL